MSKEKKEDYMDKLMQILLTGACGAVIAFFQSVAMSYGVPCPVETPVAQAGIFGGALRLLVMSVPIHRA